MKIYNKVQTNRWRKTVDVFRTPSRVTRFFSRATVVALAACALLLLPACTIVTPLPSDLRSDQSPPLHNVEALLRGLPEQHTDSIKIKGTALKAWYNRFVDHIQGITSISNHYIISHSSGNVIGGKGLAFFVVGDGNDKCTFHFIEDSSESKDKFPHAGGIQACGQILVAPFETRYGPKGHYGIGSEIRFIDFSKPHNPVILPLTIERPNNHAACAGLAYHSQERRHYVVVYDGETADLYRSNGLPLSDRNCGFELLVKMTPPKNTSGDATNLLYEDTGKLYLAWLARDSAGYEQIVLNQIKQLGKEAQLTPILTKRLSKASWKNSVEPGFRWGGGIVEKDGGRRIEVLAVSRNMGAVWQGAKICLWKSE